MGNLKKTLPKPSRKVNFIDLHSAVKARSIPCTLTANCIFKYPAPCTLCQAERLGSWVIGNLCEFRMWNKGFTNGAGSNAFFKKTPAAFGTPSLFDFPITYRYQVKDGAKGPPHPCDKNKGKGPCSHTCSTVGKNAVCSCPTGYALHSNKKTCIADGFKLKGDGFYYKYFKAAKNYNAAQADCRKYNGNLAIIWNDVTSKIVRSIMAHGWIGGSDRKNEGKWITPDTPWDPRRGNKNLPWKNWNRGEPNNAGNEDCLHQLTSRKWNDLPCRLNQPYTCQIRYFT